MTVRRKAGTPTSMIARVALVLDAVEGHSPTAVSEVARDTGLPKATVSRGWSQTRGVRGPGARVVPALAGVVPGRPRCASRRARRPRARGGGPARRTGVPAES